MRVSTLDAHLFNPIYLLKSVFSLGLVNVSSLETIYQRDGVLLFRVFFVWF